MRKYLTIIKTEFQRQLTFRSDIASYVFGDFVHLFGSVVLWSIIFASSDTVKGYNYSEMMTYIIIGWVFKYLTENYNFENRIAGDIHKGRLSNYLIKPISYLRYSIAVAGGRVTVALFFILLQAVLYIIFFGDNLIFNLSIYNIFILVVMLFLTFFIKLFFSVIIGLISFWTMEVRGVQSFFDVLINFLSGGYFPISMLPFVVVKISYFFPFIYTFFIPVQFYLGKISVTDALKGISVQFVWVVLLYIIIKIIWWRGLKKYEGFGA